MQAVITSVSSTCIRISVFFFTLSPVIISNRTGTDTFKPLVYCGIHLKMSAAVGAVRCPLRWRNVTNIKASSREHCKTAFLTCPKHIPPQNSWQGWQLLVETSLNLIEQRKIRNFNYIKRVKTFLYYTEYITDWKCQYLNTTFYRLDHERLQLSRII